jgi:predicted metal-dependent phosphoesterase TrpH
MILVDLHLHSTFSDGSLTPEQLADQGKHRGLSVMSLTDHDTTAGLPSFMAACSRLNVRAVAGIELSADYPSTMHILGYRLDFSHPSLEKTLESIRKARDWRNSEMCRNLRKIGFDITLEEVEAEAAGDVVARPHMA